MRSRPAPKATDPMWFTTPWAAIWRNRLCDPSPGGVATWWWALLLGLFPPCRSTLRYLKVHPSWVFFRGEFAKREPGRNAAMLALLGQWYQEGKIKPVIDTALPFTELKQAFERMAVRDVKGKLVLVR